MGLLDASASVPDLLEHVDEMLGVSAAVGGRSRQELGELDGCWLLGSAVRHPDTTPGGGERAVSTRDATRGAWSPYEP
ncbi:unnamed protein product [Phytophthora fragariaefolia]|uniref:Unnamed protein product n=1 Tax=Phytophthora fragariaefolia TaxID=1490495 RepID=A0A9W7CU61_9STRA|nr:unnamed protein product [Phytophthora fragariaefolia]